MSCLITNLFYASVMMIAKAGGNIFLFKVLTQVLPHWILEVKGQEEGQCDLLAAQVLWNPISANLRKTTKLWSQNFDGITSPMFYWIWSKDKIHFKLGASYTFPNSQDKTLTLISTTLKLLGSVFGVKSEMFSHFCLIYGTESVQQVFCFEMFLNIKCFLYM